MAANAPSDHPSEAPTDTHPIGGLASTNTPEGAGPYAHISKDLSDFIAARAELASIEAKEAAQYAAAKTTHGIILGICAFFTWVLFLAGLATMLAPPITRLLTDNAESLIGWIVVLIILSLSHAAGALIFFNKLKQKPSSPLFELSLQEIQHDKQWITKNK